MKSRKIKKYTKEQRFFVEKEKIEKYLNCPICQEIFDDPYRITCGHTFCKKCLNQWEKKSNNDVCPLCRNEYIKNFSGKDLIAQSIINDAIVTCIYKGCPWKEKLSGLQNHIQNCLFDPGKLPNFMKQANFFEKENKNQNNIKLDENEEELGNICSFNYNSSIKERIFSRNPNLVQKLFGEDNKEKNKGDEYEVKQKKEKISENDDVNDFYNFLLIDNKDNNISKIDTINNKEQEKNIPKNNKEKNNENEPNLQGSSSIMNIFINPTITLSSNNFLNKKIDKEIK